MARPRSVCGRQEEFVVQETKKTVLCLFVKKKLSSLAFNLIWVCFVLEV